MKTIKNGQPVIMSNWNINRKNERAMVQDMGVQEDYKNIVTDEDRVYASVRTMFLTSNAALYEIEEQKFADPLVLEDGEIVILEGNGKQYKVHAMRPKFEYISDIIHFELVH